MLNMRSQIFTVVILGGLFWVVSADANNPKVAIASAHPLATDAGLEIIAKGGNVFDAAVAVGAALAVVEPAGSGLGGGGYWLLHRAKDHLETMIDGREKAPLAAHKAMFLDKSGKVIPKLSLDGALAAAIPRIACWVGAFVGEIWPNAAGRKFSARHPLRPKRLRHYEATSKNARISRRCAEKRSPYSGDIFSQWRRTQAVRAYSSSPILRIP